jgi:hypothetical protein
MVAEKTEFLDGIQLFYPLEVLPKLFKTIGTNSRNAFFGKLAKIDGPDGEGTPIESLIEFIRIGLLWKNPVITSEEATKLVSQYYETFGYEAIEMIVTEAFANSLLTDREVLDRNKQLAKEVKELQFQQVEAALKKKKELLEGDKGEVKKPSTNGSRKSKG